MEHALHDGEDYELLFTSKHLSGGGDFVSKIGVISADPGIWLEHRDGSRESLEPKSWEHTF
jgi:thiamine monophosphate kinase